MAEANGRRRLEGRCLLGGSAKAQSSRIQAANTQPGKVIVLGAI